MKSLMAQLTSIQEEVKELDAIAMLLKSMPVEYNNIWPTLKYMKDPSLREIESALLEEEKRIKNGTTPLDLNSAFYSKASIHLDKSKRCNHCGRLGHVLKDCRFKDRPPMTTRMQVLRKARTSGR